MIFFNAIGKIRTSKCFLTKETFNVLIFCNAIGKIRTLKCLFIKEALWQRNLSKRSRLIHFIENNVDICRRWRGKPKESLENPRKNLPEMSKILNILIKKLDFLKSAKKVKHFWLSDFTYGIIKVQNWL